MASYFGEIIHPSSRAFWTDDDDDDALESSQDNVEFTIDWHELEPSQFEKFLIVEGEILIDFVENCLLKNAKNICSIKTDSDKNCTKVYLLDNVYICTVNTKLNLAQAGQLTGTLAPLITKSKSLYTLTSDHMSHFKSEEEINSASVLKCLYSSKARSYKNSKISALNQPNIVTGVSAGVLSYAEITNLHCVMYILYTDTFTLDSKNALPLIELLSDLLEKPLSKFTAISSSFFNKGNLYM